MVLVNLDGPAAFDLLKGFVCLYKPPSLSSRNVIKSFIGNLVADLNELAVRPPKPFVKIEGNTTQPMKVSVIESYSDHPLVVGPRYQEEDFKYQWATFLGRKTSGVAILAINRPSQIFESDHWNHSMKTYHIKGKLGLVTDNMFSDGKVLFDNVKYKFIRDDHIDKVISSLQNKFQRRMFELAGVDISSQAAYDLAVQGPIRPAILEEPVVYAMRCVNYAPPDFTIEVQCIGEYEEFLIRLIYDMGQKLRSAAVCTSIQCIRHAQFTLEQSLLRKHWRLQNVIQQMIANEKLIQSMETIRPHLQNISVNSDG